MDQYHIALFLGIILWCLLEGWVLLRDALSDADGEADDRGSKVLLMGTIIGACVVGVSIALLTYHPIPVSPAIKYGIGFGCMPSVQVALKVFQRNACVMQALK